MLRWRRRRRRRRRRLEMETRVKKGRSRVDGKIRMDVDIANIMADSS